MSTEWEEDGDPWTVKSVSQPFANDWFKIDTHAVIHPGGAEGTYSVIRIRRLAVGVLPIGADGRVHLVGQWRFPLGRYSWEMPEGGAEPDEAPLMCAVRELKEETGLRAGELREVLEMDMSNSLTDERCIIFLATDLTPGEASPEPTEVLKRRTTSFTELLDRVVDGRIRDSMTVAAVLRAHHMAVTGQLPAELAKAMLARGTE
ncbi:ADP-ribose pyrophosphatase [alpha proteobacterium U9-1i]|nr:ADP-ribose pyrophosphatase [alpha proteobacterium U9-1i]